LRNRSLVFIFLTLCILFVGLPFASAQIEGNTKPDFPRFNFNAGGGLGIGRGAVGKFVGNSFEGTAGAGLNFSRMFGVSAEYMYYNLDLRQGVRDSQSLPNASGSLNAISLNGIVRIPYHLGRFGAYGIFGVGFYRRSETTHQVLPVGAICQPAWIWWDVNCTGNPPSIQNNPQTLGSFTKDAGGYNYGGGMTYRLDHLHNAKLFIEYRHHQAYHSDVMTVVWPITVGLRW
jgi:hypothetical protein